VIGYNNTNIDIIEGDQIYNIPDIKRKQLTANKTINNIMILEDFAYLSCGFGIVVVNLEKKEIKDSYFIGQNGAYLNVYDMAFDGTWLYAATETGIYRADINSPNLVDFNNWSRMQDIPNPGGEFVAVKWFNDRLYAAYRNKLIAVDSLYYQSGSSWERFDLVEDNRLRSLWTDGISLVVVTGLYATTYNAAHETNHIISSTAPLFAVRDGTGLWGADNTFGMFFSPAWEQKEFIIPNGPLSGEVASIAIQDDLIYTAAGSVTSGWGSTYRFAELNTLNDGLWSGTSIPQYRDLIQISVNPADKHHVFGSAWGYGMIEYMNGEAVRFIDQTNSSLQTLEGDNAIRVGGSVFDQGNNLIVTNPATAEPISIRKPDGEWKSLAVDGKLKVQALGSILNTSVDHNWVICPLGQGLFAMDINRTVDDISDDRYEKFSIVDVNGKIITNNVYALAEDQNNNIWVGTDKGIVVYYSPTRVFDEDLFYGQQIIVPRNDGTGLADILLGTEKVTAVAVDGANRKWLGTEKSGVYLVSEDGLEEVSHFTAENSPMLSNNITDIKIDGKTGVVYFGTDRGLISYKGTAIQGRDNYGDVYVYPNPVRPDFEGDIVITNLVGDVNVKITDIAGNIVYETTSLGGQALWDGRSFSGERVSTGVYMIFCTNDDGSQTHITKLLIIN
jgi:hypothetical protein